MTQRFTDDRDIYAFARTFLVECPKCAACATVADMTDGKKTPFFIGEKRFICDNCGSVALKEFNSYMISDEGFDWYFCYPLYLKIDCCGHVLWANNEEHLIFLQNYTEAKLRDEGDNRSLTNRLPRWLKDAKNRNEVLRCIQKLKDKLKNK